MPGITRALLLLVTCCCMLATVAAVPAPGPGKKGIKFDFKTPGSAKAELGEQKLFRIAKRSKPEGTTVDELALQIETEADLGVDLDNDLLVYACAGMVLDPNLAAATDEAAADDAQPADDGTGAKHHHHHHHHKRHLLQTDLEFTGTWLPENADPAAATLTKEFAFTLHSRPNSQKKIFLDFDGHTTPGPTAWSANSIVTPPYDTDGVPSTFSATELSNIFQIWRHVAEDYAAFDVDVTTEEPVGLPKPQWVRAAIGGSSYDWYGAGAGGVAYVGVWGNTYNGGHYYQPAYVFTQQLGNGAPKYTAEAISHEIGHNMGLSHDGTSTVGYYGGQSGWAPIMGVGYYEPLSQWSKGEYPGANNREDDYTVISGRVGYVAQEHGMTTAAATMLTGQETNGVTTAQLTGIVRRDTETEVLAFSANAGTATIQVMVSPYSRTNLRMNVQVQDANLAVLADQTGAGMAPFTVTLPQAGTYYILIKGAGLGDLTTGYSNYGSRGQYQVVATYPTGAAPPPPPPPAPLQYMTVSSFTDGGSGTAKSGNKVQVTCKFNIQVVDKVTAAAVNAPTLAGTWTVSNGGRGPITSPTTVAGTAAGVVTVTYTAPRKAAGSCTFRIDSISHPDYTGGMDATTTLVSRSYSWI